MAAPLPNPSAPTSPYTCIAVLENSLSNFYMWAISSDGRKCLSCYVDHDAMWWDLSQPPCKQATEIIGIEDHAECVAMSHDGMRVVLGNSVGCGVQVWDAASGDSRRLEVPSAAEQDSEGVYDNWPSITCVAITGNGKYAAAGGHQLYKHTETATDYEASGAWLCVWDLEERGTTPSAVINLPDGQEPTALSISSDGHWVTAITAQDRVRRWEVGSKVLGALVVLDGAVGTSFDQSSISSDGRTAVACKDRQVQVWDLTTGNLTATLEGHTNYIWAASISADGRRAVSGGRDSLVKVWDLESKTCLATLEGHRSSVREASLSADGKHVVSAAYNGVVRVWQLGV